MGLVSCSKKLEVASTQSPAWPRGGDRVANVAPLCLTCAGRGTHILAHQPGASSAMKKGLCDRGELQASAIEITNSSNCQNFVDNQP